MSANQKYKFSEYGGKQNNLLTPVREIRNEQNKRFWECSCACGRPQLVRVTPANYVKGGQRSCGCLNFLEGKAHRDWSGYEEMSGSLFGGYVSGAKKRNIPFDLTIKQIWDLYIAQGKRCALSGEPITLAYGKKKKTASLDRIDSSKSYTIDNVQWVHRKINWMKNTFSQEEFIKLCTLVADYNRK